LRSRLRFLASPLLEPALNFWLIREGGER
jgi:hypothetical protein